MEGGGEELFVLGRGEGLSLFDVYCEYHRCHRYHTGRTGRGVVWGGLGCTRPGWDSGCVSVMVVCSSLLLVKYYSGDAIRVVYLDYVLASWG